MNPDAGSLFKTVAMKRWITPLGIGTYLLALAVGFVTHALDFATDCHPVLYFLVWDMFCGWSGYEGRMQVLGEGESGKFYELAPYPWGAFHPYGFIDRHHYDPNQLNGFKFARNCLRHTRHEPMVRLFVVEEEYPKKFNIPDEQYAAYYGKPKQVHPYYHTRFILTPDGAVLGQRPSWFVCQHAMTLGDNPRLMADAHHTLKILNPLSSTQSRGSSASTLVYDTSSGLSLASPLAQ